jgi:hypothetical protein
MSKFPIYESPNKDRYFGSDLNKFMNKLSKEMTVINIDCLAVKREKKILRLIESKYPEERPMKWGQKEIFRKILPPIFKTLNQISLYLDGFIKNWEFEIFIVTGKPPYEEIKIEDLINNKIFNLKGKDVIDWLEFNLKLEQIKTTP